ncbi:hypothetical protein LBMAG21_06520 [Armatimonadota bacterium]|nr:hypothetical protein LBMAG21_06520 [Armatimonadota bacterium]
MSPSPLDPKSPLIERRFLSRTDALLLTGMALLAVSLFCVWKREPVALPPGAQVFLVTEQYLEKRGFDLPQWGWMLGCGAACNLFLLWDSTPQNRSILAVLQGVAGLGALLFALRNTSGEIGAMMGLCGGLLLAWGALNRYQEITQSGDAQEIKP